MSKLLSPYDICVIDVGSPKLGNLGWCYIDMQDNREYTGFHLDEVLPYIEKGLGQRGLVIGLEAPLFVPLRPDIMLATKGRNGEGRRPWSAGAGAQVLALNLPIMVYLFAAIARKCPQTIWHLTEEDFSAAAGTVMVFEALVSGADKGSSHIQDAQIMAHYCQGFSEQQTLPPSILQYEQATEFFNLAGAALMRVGGHIKGNALHAMGAIYKPSSTG